MTKILDGKALAEKLTTQIAEEVGEYCKTHRPPCLAIVSSGTDPASRIYVKTKTKALEKAGMKVWLVPYKDTDKQEFLIEKVKQLNSDETVDGILVQLPLPKHISERKVLNSVDPSKDVDGFTSTNLGQLFAGTPSFIPCTPQGIITLLKENKIEIEGKTVVIVGRSNIVGKPLSTLFLSENATVIVCHSKTKDLREFTQKADILVSAVGIPYLIKDRMVKEEAVVIDVGINKVLDSSNPKGYKIVGDVDFENVSQVTSWITPVPGGVGPLTVAMVLKNTLEAAKLQSKKKSEKFKLNLPKVDPTSWESLKKIPKIKPFKLKNSIYL